jgi:predicted RND superfamily exporter protein
VFLTSLTTFVGLTPMMLERSAQAQFLIPMAISLAFGVAFATAITLLLLPCSYLVLEDLKVFGARGEERPAGESSEPEPKPMRRATGTRSV